MEVGVRLIWVYAHRRVSFSKERLKIRSLLLAAVRVHDLASRGVVGKRIRRTMESKE